MRIAAIGAVLAASLAVLGGCNTAPVASPGQSPAVADAAKSADLPGVYAGLQAGGGQVFALDPAGSSVRILAFRGGIATSLGHNHVLSAPRFTGFVHVPGVDLSKARFDLEFRLDQLEFDKPGIRAQLGEPFASTFTADESASVRGHMLGDENFQADRFPYVRFHSLRISGEAPRIAAKVRIEIHGQERELWLPLEVSGLPGALSVRGSFVLRQSDFGVQTFSALGGFLAMQDEVLVDFDLHGAIYKP